VDNYLAALSEKIDKKEENRNAIMALAGSWSDMDDDFELSEAWKAEIDRREAEIDRREAEIDSGESVGKPAKEVLAKYKRN
jgi:hypothetical protein